MVGNSVFTQNNAKRLFSPRIGLAWDPFGNGKTAVRAGFGTYYSLIDDLAFLLNSLPPYNGSVTSQFRLCLPQLSRKRFLIFVYTVHARRAPPACGPALHPALFLRRKESSRTRKLRRFRSGIWRLSSSSATTQPCAWPMSDHLQP